MSENIHYEIDKGGKKIRIVSDLSKEVDKHIREYLKNGGKIAEIDAELNGGALFEVATVMGKPLYVRLAHHDPERANHELAKIKAVVKSAVMGNE